jgi:hypothetical protein
LKEAKGDEDISLKVKLKRAFDATFYQAPCLSAGIRQENN